MPSVSGSLTLQGRANLVKNIDALVKEMDNPKILKANLKLFWKWYDDRFYYRWRNFALSFKDAQKFLHSNADAQSTLYSMSSDTNPYFTLIQTMAKEFKAYKSIGKTPAWTKLVIELDSIMGVATNIRNSKNSLLSKVGSEKDTLVANVEQTIDNNINTKQIKSATLFNKYIADLTSFSIVVDKKKSQLLISDFFTDTPSKAALSPSFSECQNHYNQFKHSSPYYANSEFVYELVSGPKDYIINYSIENMNHVLNTQWKNMVLGSIPLSTDSNLLMSLFHKQKGLVWKFVEEQLKPFVTLNRYGYNVKKVSGFKLDIKPSFLRYINSGINLLNVYKPQYNVKISTLPFDINNDAKVEANFVSLHLICAKQDYILDNDNYKLSKTFTWRPSKCGDTILTFSFNDFKVKKTYKGENGFLYFLKDFKDGTHSFTDKDFDQNIPQLKQQNIKSIRLSYNISGEGDMLKLLDKTPYNVPKKVTNSRW
jgi:type VI secretion system protein ImpL